MILAIIRMAKINATKNALAAAGLPSFTATGEVQGRGRGRGLGSNYSAIAQTPEFEEQMGELGESRLKTKRMITLMVTDDKCNLAVKTIIDANKTDNSGDGKIFVLEANDAYNVRTGESGDKILD